MTKEQYERLMNDPEAKRIGKYFATKIEQAKAKARRKDPHAKTVTVTFLPPKSGPSDKPIFKQTFKL